MDYKTDPPFRVYFLIVLQGFVSLKQNLLTIIKNYEWILALAMFGTLVATLLLGFPVAFTLGAIAIFFGIPTLGLDIFSLLPMRIYGIMTNFTLLAVPLLFSWG